MFIRSIAIKRTSPILQKLVGSCVLTTILLMAMMSLAQAQESSAAKPTQEPTPPRAAIGHTTRSLLQAQVDGSMAGPSLPMLGATSSLSWQRYLDSYRHPIPETFTRRIEEASVR